MSLQRSKRSFSFCTTSTSSPATVATGKQSSLGYSASSRIRRVRHCSLRVFPPQPNKHRRNRYRRPLIASHPEQHSGLGANEFGDEAISEIDQDIELDELAAKYAALLQRQER